MRQLVTHYDRKNNILPSRFEPSAAEVFSIDLFPNKEFITIVVGKQHDETGCFCRDCFLYKADNAGKRLCECGKVVCRSYERKDGRQVVVYERKPITWNQ